MSIKWEEPGVGGLLSERTFIVSVLTSSYIFQNKAHVQASTEPLNDSTNVQKVHYVAKSLRTPADVLLLQPLFCFQP